MFCSVDSSSGVMGARQGRKVMLREGMGLRHELELSAAW